LYGKTNITENEARVGPSVKYNTTDVICYATVSVIASYNASVVIYDCT